MYRYDQWVSAQLEAEQHRGAQRRELERALPRRNRGDDACERKHRDLEDDLRGREVGDAARVVLTPVPGRERRVAAELVGECAMDEVPRRVYDARLEEQDGERHDGRDRECRREPQRPIAGAARAGT